MGRTSQTSTTNYLKAVRELCYISPSPIIDAAILRYEQSKREAWGPAETRKAHDDLARLLKHSNLAYRASDGRIYGYSKIEQTLWIIRPSGRNSKSGSKHIPEGFDKSLLKVPDPRVLVQQEYRKQAEADRQAIHDERQTRKAI